MKDRVKGGGQREDQLGTRTWRCYCGLRKGVGRQVRRQKGRKGLKER